MRRRSLAALVLMTLVACDDGPSPAKDPVDAGISDALVVDQAVAPDAEIDLALEPDAAPPDLGPPVDSALPPPMPAQVTTTLGAPSTEAGAPNRVSCVVLDAAGEPVDDVDTRIEVRPGDGWITAEVRPDDLIGEVAGTYQVTCVAPSVGLRDVEPARWDVLPGPAAQLVATVHPSSIRAGASVEVTCAAADALGNPVDAREATVETAPLGAGTEIDDRTVTLRTAGRFRVGCRMAGVVEHVDSVARVRPDVPAALAASLDPLREVYRLGEVVGFPALVTDQFGNRVEAADLVWSLDPGLPGFAEGRYLAEREGLYHVDVRVDGPTFEDRELTAEADFVVDGGGPALTCAEPADGVMIRAQPGAPQMLRVQVTDQLTIESLTVDGNAARAEGGGVFAVEVPTHWGLNAHEVVAQDAAGNVSSRFCSRFVSAEYLGEEAPATDAIALYLTQRAVDDGNPDRPLTSLTDLVRRVINSDGLVSTLDTALRSQNPIVPNDCRARIPIINTCIARFGATYSSMSVRGPHTISARLVNGGLQLTARINNLTITGRSTGTLNLDFRVTVSFVEVGMTFDINLRNGRPNVSVRSTDAVRVGAIDLDLPGAIGNLFDGVVNLVFGAFEGLVRDELTSAIRGFISTEVDALLSGVLSGLDLASLGVAFEVPGIGGGAPTPLSFGLDFSTMNATARRLLIGISSVVNGPTRQARASAGVPVPPGPRLLDLAPQGSLGAAVNLVFINQVLHRLWRAGLFDLGDAGALLGDLPDGAAMSLQVLTPPAARGTGDEAEIELFLGPAVGALTYPGFFDEPLQIRLAARITASVALQGGDQLEFGDLTVTELKLGIDDAAIGAEARAAMEADVRRIVQAVVDSALNDLLPALPIPDFALPNDLNQFGIERGTRLGLRGAQLLGTESHFILDGSFSE